VSLESQTETRLRDAIALGQLMQSSRLEFGLTLDEIGRRTRVPAQTFRQLEAGCLDGLPADVFVRGFLRAYAREVKADAEQLVQHFDAALEARREARAPVAVPVGDQASALDGRRRFAVALFVLILIVIVTLTVSLLLQRGAPEQQ